MKIAIMQPYFFPYIGYWQLIDCADVFVIYDDVNYIKKGYINRNSILIREQKHRLTLELIGSSQNKNINEIQVGNNQKKLIKTIKMAYSKSPYFATALPLIEEILSYEENNLAQFLNHSLQNISRELQLNTKFIFSSDIKKDNKLTGQDKIIEIAEILNATEYINPIGGKDLYDKNILSRKNIKLSFLKASHIEYKQYNNKFIPNLSIIDILMFNSLKNIKAMLPRYELI